MLAPVDLSICNIPNSVRLMLLYLHVCVMYKCMPVLRMCNNNQLTRASHAVTVEVLPRWPVVFAAPDQKSTRIVHLLAEEIVPLFGVPDALLSDRGANLLSHLMQDVCRLLGIIKLNTTAYHPQCDGIVERLHRTLKAMLRKACAKFGGQWDHLLPGVLCCGRIGTRRTNPRRKSRPFSFCLKSPTEAALLPPQPTESIDLTDYREDLVLLLAAASGGFRIKILRGPLRIH